MVVVIVDEGGDDRRLRSRPPLQLALDPGLVGTLDIGTEKDVPRPAAALLLVEHGDVSRERIGDRRRRVDVGLDVVVVGIADRSVEVTLALVGIVGNDRDQAAGNFAAVERALRPLKHFDPVNVVERIYADRRISEVEAVDIDRDLRLVVPGRRRSDAAQEHVVAARRHRDQSRGQGDELIDAGDVERLEGVCGDRLARRGHSLQTRRATRGGDDDVLDADWNGVGGRRRCGVGRNARRRRCWLIRDVIMSSAPLGSSASPNGSMSTTSDCPLP